MQEYRDLLEVPTEFQDGFGWNTVIGIFFCGLIMMPGGIYLGLMTGGNMGMAASWVTVILFMEIARRALKPMSKQNLVILLHAARVMMIGHILFPGGPMGQLVYRAYLVGSDAVRDAGMLGEFPSWFAPHPDSPAILERNFLHIDWAVPIGIALFLFLISTIQRYTLGYIFFRITSDVENLPYPLAPIGAQGATALAESDDHLKEEDQQEGSLEPPKKKKKSLRWRIFTLGAYIGIGFGFLQVGIPAISGLFLSKPFYLIPQPFIDTTTLTETILPATPTGIAFDLGLLFLGFVLPFWAILGTLAAVLLTAILNPILHHWDVLQTWQPGMNTVNTTFSNNIDFWLSFGIGTGLGIAAVSLYCTIRDVRRKMKDSREGGDENRKDIWAVPEGRGDHPLWISISIYVLSAIAMVSLCYYLLPKNPGIILFLVFFAFVYSPFLSYVNARLLGISGQQLQIRYVKEISFLLSGAKGIEIWLAPIPIKNYGIQSQAFRINELTGVSFWSLIKTELVAVPVLFILSLAFWGFIWHSDAVPSDMFPAAQVNWELHSKTQTLLFSSTFVAKGENPEDKKISDSEFMKAIHPKVIGVGFAGIVGLFALFSTAGLPVMLIYGMIRGFGRFPHLFLPQIAGAFLARYYLRKKFGVKNFLQMAPILMAGYSTGVGLIAMATIALKLIKAAVSTAPF